MRSLRATVILSVPIPSDLRSSRSRRTKMDVHRFAMPSVSADCHGSSNIRMVDSTSSFTGSVGRGSTTSILRMEIVSTFEVGSAVRAAGGGGLPKACRGPDPRTSGTRPTGVAGGSAESRRVAQGPELELIRGSVRLISPEPPARHRGPGSRCGPERHVASAPTKGPRSGRSSRSVRRAGWHPPRPGLRSPPRKWDRRR